jgi:tetratricopeptide (TPR) repeat protein
MHSLIKNSFEKGRLIIFLGAGASYTSQTQKGGRIPLGEELAQILSAEIGLTYSGESLGDVYDAAKYKLGDIQLNEVFIKNFKNTRPSDDYKKLVNLPLTRIYSLNIDDCIERAFSSVVSHDSSRTLETYRNNDPVREIDQFFQRIDLIKLNGDILYPKEGFIFSEQEYATGSTKEPLWYSELARDFTRYTIVFIGTKLKEPLMLHQIEKYKNRANLEVANAFLITPDTPTEIEKISFSKYKITHIQATLSDFVNWFIQEYPEGYSSRQIITAQRPELSEVLERSDEISLFDKIIPVSISNLYLMEAKKQEGFFDFYKGFKPTWQDILLSVPAYLKKVKEFEEVILDDYYKDDLKSVYLIEGAAGSGKSTALKQISLNLSKKIDLPIYFLEENKHDFISILQQLYQKNERQKIIICIERLSYFYRQITSIFENNRIDVVIIAAENPRILSSKIPIEFQKYIKRKTDISLIDKTDVPLLLEKIQKHGNWVRLHKMSVTERQNELFSKSKRQLLIGLLETTFGIGFKEIIRKDYMNISSDSERFLIILAGIATFQNTVSNEVTLSRALEFLELDSNVEKHCQNLIDIVQFQRNGEITTRHRLYIKHLFADFITLDQIEDAITAYIHAFTVYSFPIIKSLNSSESMVYKFLVNAKSLSNLLKGDKERILRIYKKFEKKLELEGLFLMQYGLALRSFDQHDEAYIKLQHASIAYPDSPHIEHALAVQLLILCFKNPEDIALAYLDKALNILRNLRYIPNNKFFSDEVDMYPIVTLSEGHICVLHQLNRIDEAKILAKTYYETINRMDVATSSKRLLKTKDKLLRYYVSGTSFSFLKDEIV